MNQEKSMGQEIMRVEFGTTEVKELKMKFANLFDELVNRVKAAEVQINSTPTIISDDTIKNHMETIRKNEELMRCMSEACKMLEIACIMAVKGIIA